MERAVLLMIPDGLRRWLYPGAELEWLLPSIPSAPEVVAMRLSSGDPYATVVGHYLGLSESSDLRSEEETPGGREFQLEGTSFSLAIEGRPTTTTILVTLHGGSTERPPRPIAPIGPYLGAEVRAEHPDVGFDLRVGPTNPLAPDEA